MPLPDRALRHYRRQGTISAGAALAARRQVLEHPDDVGGLVRTLSRYQVKAAREASLVMAGEADREPLFDPMAIAGRSTAGFDLTLPAAVILDDLATRVEDDLDALTVDMLGQLDRFVQSEVQNAGRDAVSVEMLAEPLWDNYVRVLNPPSCPRCAILAGRIYRDNEGFLRHPQCDCVHWPVEHWEQAIDEGFLFSAETAFERGEIRGLSKADERAIRDGASIVEVVNAARDMRTASIFGRHGLKITLSGTTRRGRWRQLNPDRPIRLRPESIYDLTQDRAEQLRLLRLYGFLNTDVVGTGRRSPAVPDSSRSEASLASKSTPDPIDPGSTVVVPADELEVREIVTDAFRLIGRVHTEPDGLDRLPLETFNDPDSNVEALYAMLGPAPHTPTSRYPIAWRMRLNQSAEHPHLSLVHEYGHFLDHRALGADPEYYASATEHAGAVRELMDAIEASAAFGVLEEMRDFEAADGPWAVWSRLDDDVVRTWNPDPEMVEYLLDPRELFARAYSQWIAFETNDPTLLASVLRNSQARPGRFNLLRGQGIGHPAQWTVEDFEPIAAKFVLLFIQLGLYRDS